MGSFYVMYRLCSDKRTCRRPLVERNWEETTMSLNWRSPSYDPRARSGPQRHFANDYRKILFLRNICWFGGMQHIPKQSRYVSFPALNLLCNSLCGPLSKIFGEPWFKRSVSAWMHLSYYHSCGVKGFPSDPDEVLWVTHICLWLILVGGIYFLAIK